ncbi:MAG: 50S ribosomal protein L15e [Methanomicrobium sp.]|jgi:large subunit ribosomal protein L15e|uniref:50S ribosomal protein L15e n=1 Tax=Methanomicrobium mobile TaxID=2205 RepID=UPI0005B2914C|nr:50S ribosomal protein L15e [Methanomicrobium mobile]MBP5475173.1 50S ribosomal protein L15e [Methanomicrobium sp.]
MAKSMYGYVRDAWKRPDKTEVKGLLWSRMQDWRKEGSVIRVERPTRIDRARSLGYRAKQGIIVVRVKIRRGGRRKSRYIRGRRTARMGMRRNTMGKSIQRMAEERASRRYTNLEVLNSYWVGEDGRSKWYEVILVDGNHPAIKSDAHLSWFSSNKNTGRAERGRTSAGMKGRGMRKRGTGTEHTRPSIRSNQNRGK